MKNDKNITHTEGNSYLQKTRCESTHLSQSPIVERINHELQDFKENKSLLEEFDNMLIISDDDDLRFYKENKVPKLKSFVCLLREFGLDTHTFYHYSNKTLIKDEKQATVSQDFLDDLSEYESEKGNPYNINCK
jgi:hypothetical protein